MFLYIYIEKEANLREHKTIYEDVSLPGRKKEESKIQHRNMKSSTMFENRKKTNDINRKIIQEEEEEGYQQDIRKNLKSSNSEIIINSIPKKQKIQRTNKLVPEQKADEIIMMRKCLAHVNEFLHQEIKFTNSFREQATATGEAISNSDLHKVKYQIISNKMKSHNRSGYNKTLNSQTLRSLYETEQTHRRDSKDSKYSLRSNIILPKVYRGGTERKGGYYQGRGEKNNPGWVSERREENSEINSITEKYSTLNTRGLSSLALRRSLVHTRGKSQPRRNKRIGESFI